jgi:hypothetical protein
MRSTATSAVEEAGVELLDGYKRRPSFQALSAGGYQVLTF